MASLLLAPLSCVGSALAQCAGACAATACCKLLTCGCLASPLSTNIFYSAILLVATVAALILRYTRQDLSVCVSGDCDDGSASTWMPTGSASYDLCQGGRCEGMWAVFRISFSLAALFSVLLLLSCCKSEFSVLVHRGFWAAKLVGLAAIAVGTLFTPNDVFAYYAWVARFIAPGFLLYQLVSFVDAGYTINERLVDRDEESPPRPLLCFANGSGVAWKGLNLLLCLCLYSALLAGTGAMYYFFPQADCPFNPSAITSTLAMSLLNTGLSVSNVAPHGALLTSAFVSAYCTWVCYGALTAMPYADCNPSAGTEGVAMTAVSLGIATATVAYLTFTAARREERRASDKGRGAAGGGGGAADAVSVYVDGEAEGEGEGRGRLPAVQPQSFASFYAVMVLISVYIAMLLTNWGTEHYEEAGTNGTATNSTAAEDAEALLFDEGSYNASLTASWVLIGTGWLCSLLYCWTLIAPRLCPSRDFGVEL